MKDRAIKHLMRSYGIDIENDDEFLSYLRKIMDDLYVKCPLCGEAENLHENTNYHDTSKPPEILCNECGEYFFASATINSVRPEVVVPPVSQRFGMTTEYAYSNGFNKCLSELRRLKPDHDLYRIKSHRPDRRQTGRGMKRKERVTVKWSKKENDWESRYPEWENRNARITGNCFFDMIRKWEEFMSKDWQGKPTGFKSLRQYLQDGGFDPDTFTISVYAKQKELI